jgi:hypothetical protein
MNQTQTFQEFLTSQSAQIPLLNFVINLAIAALLAYLLSRVYFHCGSSLSNRGMFGRNFVLISMTTMLIISIVKSSLALSLGLVGALSIVRFRAAIKEPEELSFLFLAIAIGLGLGADQRLTTIVAFAVIVALILIRFWIKRPRDSHNLHLTISSNPASVDLSQLVSVLRHYCKSVNLKRFDETENLLEASFQVEFDNFDELKSAKKGLQDLDKNLRITFLDTKAAM